MVVLVLLFFLFFRCLIYPCFNVGYFVFCFSDSIYERISDMHVIQRYHNSASLSIYCKCFIITTIIIIISISISHSFFTVRLSNDFTVHLHTPVTVSPPTTRARPLWPSRHTSASSHQRLLQPECNHFGDFHDLLGIISFYMALLNFTWLCYDAHVTSYYFCFY